MAIMKRCCCFSNTRSGSTAAAILNLIYGIVFIGLTGWGYLFFAFLGGIVATMFYVQFAMYGLLALTSIITMVGICKDSGALLLPHIITLALMMLLELVSYGIWLSQLGFAAIVLIVPFVMFLIFLTLNIISLLCLISQYQEYKAGRGRVCDIEAAKVTHTTVVVTGGATVMTGQQAAPGAFVVQQQNPGMVQAPPPQYDQQQDIKTY
jgi:hypothetical protein